MSARSFEPGLGGEHAAPAPATSRRSSGSPPVSRILSTPSDEEDVDQRADLLEVQHVLARQPDVVVLRHAVFAAQVAAVGDRQPQVAQRPPEAIEHSIIEFRIRELRMPEFVARKNGRDAICPSKPALQRPGTAARARRAAAVRRSAGSCGCDSRSARSAASPHAAQRVSSRSPTWPGRLPA